MNEMLELLKTNHLANVVATYAMAFGWVLGLVKGLMISHLHSIAKQK